MKPKIAYLIDEGSYWGESPEWKFHTEEAYLSERYPTRGPTKRIVYWVIDEESV